MCNFANVFIQVRLKILMRDSYMICYAFSAMDGDVERVDTLLFKGVSPDATDNAGYKPLHYAARNGHYKVCETLLQHGADVNATTRSIGATPLHRAVTQGHTKVIDLLLEHGADANLRDADGKTPLHRAMTDVDDSVLDTCKLLVPCTDLTIKDNSGRTVEECFQQRVDDKADMKNRIKKSHLDLIDQMLREQLKKKVIEEKNTLKSSVTLSKLKKKK